MNEVRVVEYAQHGVTQIHPLALVLLVCMSVLALLPKRSSATLAVLLVCVFMPLDQRIVVGGLDFSMLRLITLVALIRIFIRGEYRGLSFGKLDRLFLFWVLSASLFYVLRLGPSGIVYRLGISFDALTAFFLIRALVRSRVDVFVLWRQVAWTVLVLSPCLIYETITQHNVFGFLNYGGWDLAMVRDGTARASGPFSHSILAGTFGSVVTPVFAANFLGRKKQRLLFGLAWVGATLITAASGSSGPLIAWATGLVGWGMWRIRGRMRLILWSAVGMGVVIHFVREKPIWHLIVRVSSLTGGTGYHRYKLIDAFISHFGDWALLGTDDMAYWGWGLQDTTNQYVVEGVTGGIVTLVLFIFVLRISFVQLRRTRNVFERIDGPTSLWAFLAWGCSVSLAAHCMSFVSVSYFGQMQNFFFFFVATIPALARFKRPERVRSPAARQSHRAPAPIPATARVRAIS